MEKRFLKAIVSIVLVITLTMSNFVFLGASFVSYALDSLNQSDETNNKNVKFNAYFKTDSGEKVDIKEEKIAEQNMKLYLGVSVQDEGYFNGQVEILDSNFKLKSQELSEGINKIEDNKIGLNQLRAGEAVELELGIEAKQGEVIDSSLLSMESKIKLTGTYTNSNAKKIEIDSTKTVQLILEDPYEKNEGAELKTELITNKIYNIEGTNKRIIQIKVNSKLKENKYPVKETNIEIGVPEETEKVEVISIGTKATNGKEREKFTEDNWEYIKEENKVKVNIKNEEENGKISWNKEAEDVIVVTYILPEKAEVKNNKVKVEEGIKLYNRGETEKKAEGQLNIEEEKDGTIELEIRNTEKEIYKGKIYAKQERELKTKEQINVNYPELTDEIKIVERQATYENENTELTANVQYKTTKINKEKMQEVLGQDGTITIEDQNGRNIAEITNTTEANAEGNIEIKYETGVKEITIKTSKPEKTGIIEIEHTKAIEKEEYTKEEIQGLNKLKEEVVLLNNKATYKTETNLKETTTKAKIEINKKSISTVTENKGIEIKATLVTNKEKYDLYKNPTIRIELPSKVESVKVNSINLLYEENLKVKNAQLTENNGAKVIEVTLEGEQSKYIESEVSAGATIIINANITLNKKIASSTEKIKMTINNENATTYESNPVEKDIEIVAPTGMVVANTMENADLTSIGDENTKTKIIEVGKEAKQEEVKIDVINNNEAKVTNVKVLGKFPTKNNKNTIETEITKEIKTQGIDANKVKVYYSENENATAELTSANAWKGTITDSKNVKSYLITVNNMEQGESLSASYGVQIPEGLQYNEKAYQTYQVNYDDTLTGKSGVVKSATLGLETGKGPELKATLTATVGGEEVKDGDKVAVGEKIKYKVKVENTGTEDVKDAVLHLDIPEGTEYEVKKISDRSETPKIDEDGNVVVDQDGNPVMDVIEGVHIVTEVLSSIEDVKINLPVGEKFEKEYEVRVLTQEEQIDSIEKTTVISNKAKVKYSNVTAESNNLKLNCYSNRLTVDAQETNTVLISGQGNKVTYTISNSTNEDIENLKFKVINDDYIKLSNIITDSENAEISLENKTVTIKKLDKLSDVAIDVSIMTNTEKDIYNVKSYLNANVTVGEEKYRANEVVYTINKVNLVVNQESDTKDKYIKDGDEISYNVKIKNNSEIELSNLTFSDTVPNGLTVETIEQDNKIIERSTDTNNINNYIMKSGIALKSGEETTYKITAIVNKGTQTTETQKIANKAEISYASQVYKAEDIVNYIEALAKDNNNNNGNNADNNDNNGDSNDSTKKAYSISGIAWFDENEDGEKDSNEDLLKDIKVSLLDLDNNSVKDSYGKEIKTTTNNEGFYSLDNIPVGKYIVVFEYDTTKYMPTSYNAEGIEDSKNSKVVLNTLNIEGTEKTVANTDAIVIKDSSISNINIGLKNIKTFELKLDKTISKIIVQNSKETKTYEYDNTTTTKIELPSKYMKNTNMIIEYEIKITNIGDAEGYAKSVVDYLPSGLKFNSELNKDWYVLDSNAYNTSLANEKILPGESKTLKIVLTKSVTSENSEIVNNVAEIAESYSPSGIDSNNSKPNNKVQGESDMNNADIIIGIATGEIAINIALITVLSLIVIASGVYLINKKFIKFKI